MENRELRFHHPKRRLNKLRSLKSTESAEKKKIRPLAVSEKDQMNIIIKVLGVPNDADLSFMDLPKRKAFFSTYDNYSGKKFSSIFPSENDEWIHLIKKMLEFNPYFRYTADEWIAHPYFDIIRNKECEKNWDSKLEVDSKTKLSDVILSLVKD